MKHWVITDTHFGHTKLQQEDRCNRPEDCDVQMWNNLEEMTEPGDVVIHLGDVAIGNEHEHHRFLLNDILEERKCWLIKGSHDTKSDGWYLDRGWDFVGDQIRLNRFGIEIVLSHCPVKDDGYDLNIHGHFHNSHHRRHEPELLAVKNDKHYLVMVEHEYAPVTLESIVKEFKKG